ncbi:hypothetical protein D3C87_1654050 [compost metagenome]
MAAFDLSDFASCIVEALQCLLPCVAEFDFNEGNVIETEFLRTEDRSEPFDITFFDQSTQAQLAGCFGKTDAAGKFCDRQASIC